MHGIYLPAITIVVKNEAAVEAAIRVYLHSHMLTHLRTSVFMSAATTIFYYNRRYRCYTELYPKLHLSSHTSLCAE